MTPTRTLLGTLFVTFMAISNIFVFHRGTIQYAPTDDPAVAPAPNPVVVANQTSHSSNDDPSGKQENDLALTDLEKSIRAQFEDKTNPRWPPSRDYLMSLTRDNTLVVTIINCGFLDFTENWIQSLLQQGMGNVLIIALDRRSFEAINEYWPGHVAWPKEEFGTDELVAQDFDKGDYSRVVNCRPRFLKEILDLGIDIIYSDVDMVWLANPMDYFRDMNADFGIARGGNPEYPFDLTIEHNLCTCVLYFRSTFPNIQFLQEWADYTVRENVDYDQLSFQPVLGAMKDRLSWHLLDLDQFPPGYLYFRSEDFNITWNPTKPALMAHANWMTGNGEKRHQMETKGVWYAEEHLKICGGDALDEPKAGSSGKEDSGKDVNSSQPRLRG